MWVDTQNLAAAAATADLPDSLAAAIVKSRVVVICVSDEYARSHNCRLEAEFSKRRGKPLVFVNVGAPGYETTHFKDEDVNVVGWLDFQIVGNSLWADARGPAAADSPAGHAQAVTTVVAALAAIGTGGAATRGAAAVAASGGSPVTPAAGGAASMKVAAAAQGPRKAVTTNAFTAAPVAVLSKDEIEKALAVLRISVEAKDVVKVLRECTSDADVCVQALRVFRGSAGKKKAVDAGAPVAIVASMTAHKDVAEVAEIGCVALSNIAFESAGEQAAVDAGAPAAIVAAMAAHEGDADVAENGCMALKNIVDSPAGKQAAVDAGAPAAIVAAMAAHKDVSVVAQHGSRALSNISLLIPAGKQAVIDAKTLKAQPEKLSR